MLEGQTLFNILIGFSGAAGGWILKMIWDALSELRKDFKELNREVNQDFIRREDFKASMMDMKDDMREGFKEVKELLGAVFKRLESKADR